MAENAVRIDGTVPVTGSITTTPSGTQNVSITSAPATVNTVQVAPAGSRFYLYSLVDAPGVVATNNFLSVFNPVGSGRNVLFQLNLIQSYSTGATTTGNSMIIQRISSATGGTLVAAASVPRFVTSDGNPVAEVRTGNPTVTLVGSPANATAPSITTAGAGAGATGGGNALPGGGSFFCVPGEGAVIYTTAGDVDQRWNTTLAWTEI